MNRLWSASKFILCFCFAATTTTLLLWGNINGCKYDYYNDGDYYHRNAGGIEDSEAEDRYYRKTE